MGSLILFLLVAIIQGCIFGFATDKVVANKGYNENWFWWGFFFGFIALIVALTKPEVRVEYTVSRNPESALFRAAAAEKRKTQIAAGGGWICSRCGAENPGYTGTCGCGMSKSENEKRLRDQKKEEAELENAQKLKAYKDLLDSGVINQDEFDKKKSELLNL